MIDDGTGLVNLLGKGQHGCFPDWSPDGAKIVFTTVLDPSHPRDRLASMDADGSNQEVLVDRGINNFP